MCLFVCHTWCVYYTICVRARLCACYLAVCFCRVCRFLKKSHAPWNILLHGPFLLHTRVQVHTLVSANELAPICACMDLPSPFNKIKATLYCDVTSWLAARVIQSQPLRCEYERGGNGTACGLDEEMDGWEYLGLVLFRSITSVE